jgi:ubiquinone/menaquinone biosynthesis C-methylase UbiE
MATRIMSDARPRAICGRLRAAMSSIDEATRWIERATAIVDVARSAATAGPPVHGRPLFGLDHRTGTPLELVDHLASRGIFRKYEHVLDLGGGVGATTRYLTSRLGCSATATARTTGEATAGRLLTARAGLDRQVFHAVTEPSRLAFAEAAFTHVWAIEVLPRLGPIDRVLGEAFRVLRPGGHLGIQELVVRTDDPLLLHHGLARVETRRAALQRAGFVEIVARHPDAGRASETTQEAAAWTSLRRRLGADDALVRDRDEITRMLADGRIGVVQLTARRP